MPCGTVPVAWDELRVEVTGPGKQTKVLAGEKVIRW